LDFVAALPPLFCCEGFPGSTGAGPALAPPEPARGFAASAPADAFDAAGDFVGAACARWTVLDPADAVARRKHLPLTHSSEPLHRWSGKQAHRSVPRVQSEALSAAEQPHSIDTITRS
jgi:hypothetical protein